MGSHDGGGGLQHTDEFVVIYGTARLTHDAHGGVRVSPGDECRAEGGCDGGAFAAIDVKLQRRAQPADAGVGVAGQLQGAEAHGEPGAAVGGERSREGMAEEDGGLVDSSVAYGVLGRVLQGLRHPLLIGPVDVEQVSGDAGRGRAVLVEQAGDTAAQCVQFGRVGCREHGFACQRVGEEAAEDGRARRCAAVVRAGAGGLVEQCSVERRGAAPGDGERQGGTA